MKKNLLVIIYLLISVLSATPCFAEDSNPIEIGALFSLSGWGAQGGQAELNGTTLAVEEINSRGGIQGRSLSLRTEDNNSNLRNTATAFQKLASVDKVPVVIGPNWSEFIDIVAPLAVANKLPTVTASGYKEQQIKPNPWVFVLWLPPAIATRVLVDEILRRDISKVSVLVSENAYYQGLFKALDLQLEAGGVQIIAKMNFSLGSSDFRSAISRIGRSGSDAVIPLLLESGEFATFLKQRLELNLKLPLFGANTLPFDPVVQKNLSLANGLTYFDYITPGGRTFAARYRERFNEEPGFGSAKAYDGTYIISKALSKCGEVRSCIREHLRSIKYDGSSGIIEFNENGVIEDTSPNTRLFEVVEGRIVVSAE
jgi:branched-chain amino acid transport system substrate-binding protein